jgi:hypothetical protein
MPRFNDVEALRAMNPFAVAAAARAAVSTAASATYGDSVGMGTPPRFSSLPTETTAPPRFGSLPIDSTRSLLRCGC